MEEERSENEDIVYGGAQGAQTVLEMADPLLAFGAEIGVRQQAGKKFEAAERIANFVGQHRRHLGQRLFAPAPHLFLLHALALAYVLEDENRRSETVLRQGCPSHRQPSRHTGRQANLPLLPAIAGSGS